MVSGVYSTIFIASSFVLFWDRYVSKGKKKVQVEITEA
jgi:preprotein translocase subunit SecF